MNKGVKMKKDIHPKMFEITIKCACGSEYKTISTTKELRTDICSHCHPFYTGKQKLVDAAGRIESFNKKYNRTTTAATK